ncbi:MAG: protein-glutamate O-methyltransferase CheR [Deltaproteobacteria bacterium]|nr:protein-glutamate O-methyltransferase CheR [Deltaproteobacteria bacterium]
MLTLGINSKPKLSYETFCLLRDIIYAKCGIFFADTKKYLLETRLLRRLEEKNLKTFEDYYYFLMYDPEKTKELSNVLNSIVTNETSFFRDNAQLDAFRRGVIPKVLEEKAKSGSKSLKIWSAACSTGEEPYTLGMMLMDDALPAKGYLIDILGSDISDIVLKSAEAGVYEKYALRNTPEAFLRKYFVSNGGDSYSVSRKVHEIVKYRKVNLVDSLETRMVKGIDVIFCRNVLIYFDDASKKKAVTHLYDSLNKGGYLFVGFSETLHNITRLFRPVSIERSVVYQKV